MLQCVLLCVDREIKLKAPTSVTMIKLLKNITQNTDQGLMFNAHFKQNTCSKCTNITFGKYQNSN